MVPCDLVFSIKITEGGGGLSYLDEFKSKKHCDIVMRSLKFIHFHLMTSLCERVQKRENLSQGVYAKEEK